MVYFGKIIDKSITISQKKNSMTVSLETPEGTEVYSFDKEGRLWTALINKVSYRRGLNGNTVAKWNSGREVLHRKWLSNEENKWLLSQAHSSIGDIFQSLDSNKIVFKPSLDRTIINELDFLSKISVDFYTHDKTKFDSVYKPVGILPPDQYISVVLQLTEGCSFNKCNFCNFYRDRPFRIKTQAQFNEHIIEVKKFIGKGISLRRTIFLGDANALVVPTKILLPLIETIHTHLDVDNLGGIFAFLDGFSGEKKTIDEYKMLKKLGLEKIYVGLESGNNKLLNFLNKPGTAEEALNAVEQIKASGISVGIIVLLGAGGMQFQKDHIHDTISVINKMNLDANDLVYFSELIESEGLEYSTKAFSANLKPLSSHDRLLQRQKIEEGLVFSELGTPHISTYDIRDFVY